MTDRELWLAIRKILLEAVDVIERKLGIGPRTSELRNLHKNNNRYTMTE